jgi:hypothetical protein
MSGVFEYEQEKTGSCQATGTTRTEDNTGGGVNGTIHSLSGEVNVKATVSATTLWIYNPKTGKIARLQLSDTTWEWSPFGKHFGDQQEAVPIGVLYDSDKQRFSQVSGSDRWIPVNESQVKRFLQIHKGKAPKAISGPSEIDLAMSNIVTFANVDYAGPLAGYSTGVYDYGTNGRMLITDSPAIIQPSSGKWTTIEKLLVEQFGPEQIVYFLGWLKAAYLSLVNSTFMPGQVLILVGPADCGKTLIQNLLITPIIGGREGRPYQYMIGKTPFNSDLLKAEHQVITDDNPATDHHTRRNFGSELKKFIVDPGQRLHAKNRDGIMVNPFWRLSISVNNEPDNLMMLPPMEPSILDKIMLFSVSTPTGLPQTIEERPTYAAAIKGELPAFINFLVNDHEILPSLRGGRFGIKHYHNPDLFQAMGKISPEGNLLAMVDEHIFQHGVEDVWKGTSGELLERLKKSSGVSDEIRALSMTAKKCGTYLMRLADTKQGEVAGRVTKGSKKGYNVFTINGPRIAD